MSVLENLMIAFALVPAALVVAAGAIAIAGERHIERVRRMEMR